ncbi:MAG TPA: TIGR03118 family protein [Tepidisphaeraceae bacterium]|jgi:uncharacterized protein (TIGR03118 family)
MSIRERAWRGVIVESLEGRRMLSGGGDDREHERDFFTQTNLVSDTLPTKNPPDPNLKNAWGISNLPGSPFWVSSNGKGLAVLYDGTGAKTALEVAIPGAGGNDAAPTGQVANAGSGFVVANDDKSKSGPAKFIFVGEDGGISGWNPTVDGTRAILKADDSKDGAIYKGATLATDKAGKTFLYVTDFHNGSVDVYDDTWAEQDLPAGAFTDRKIPKGFAPFNVQNVGGKLFVTFAKQDKDAEDDLAGPGNGFVDVFDTGGKLQMRLEHNRFMNSPWGVTQAPADWGQFSGDILVGMFGSGRIAAFDARRGKFDGLLRNKDGTPVKIDGLWALTFGNGAKNADANTLYFTAGPNDESNGLFGSLTLHKRQGHDNDDDDDDHGGRGDDGDNHNDDHDDRRKNDDDGDVWD